MYPPYGASFNVMCDQKSNSMVSAAQLLTLTMMKIVMLVPVFVIIMCVIALAAIGIFRRELWLLLLRKWPAVGRAGGGGRVSSDHRPADLFWVDNNNSS